MKCRILLPACFLLLWTLAEGQGEADTGPEITVTSVSDGIKLQCGKENKMKRVDTTDGAVESLKVDYKDENSGEFICMKGTTEIDGPKIFVKFRTCENCVELDTASILGMVVGDVVATIVIGVAVYLIASQSRTGQVTMDKKRSDRQHLIPNESSNRAPNDHYQPLRPKNGQKDTYDVLTNRR